MGMAMAHLLTASTTHYWALPVSKFIPTILYPWSISFQFALFLGENEAFSTSLRRTLYWGVRIIAHYHSWNAISQPKDTQNTAVHRYKVPTRAHRESGGQSKVPFYTPYLGILGDMLDLWGDLLHSGSLSQIRALIFRFQEIFIQFLCWNICKVNLYTGYQYGIYLSDPFQDSSCFASMIFRLTALMFVRWAVCVY